MTWTDGPIEGCPIRPLAPYRDARGWLAEIFRADELAPALHPAMAYLSLTHPGVVRGPHEHRDQTDLFVFFHGRFRLYLWDARQASPTRGHRHVAELGEADPAVVVVPPGVVHAYRNVGPADGLIFNAPNRLYAGEGKREAVDEIRHEHDPDTPFRLDHADEAFAL